MGYSLNSRAFSLASSFPFADNLILAVDYESECLTLFTSNHYNRTKNTHFYCL